MANLNDIIQKMSNIEAAIENALRVEVAEAVRDAIVKSARENVYDAYNPVFLSRRNGDGGILDPESVKIEVHGVELTATDNPIGQNLWTPGGTGPVGGLANAIASGERKYNMHKAGPRPFHEKAKQEIISSGIAESALRRGLERQGYDVSGMTFRFE